MAYIPTAVAIADPQAPEPGKTFYKPPDNEAAPDAAPPPAEQPQGFLLDCTDLQAVQWVKRRRESQDAQMRSREARWNVHARRRGGDPWVRLRKIDENKDLWEVYDPPGATSAPPALSKTDDLCGKVVSTLLADPPKPDPEPSRDADDAKAAAEFSGRLLADLNSESSLNTLALLSDAEEQACASDSSFIHVWSDPFGGGYQPRQIQASAVATSVDDALFAQVPDATGAVIEVPQPGPYVVRYVAPGGALTDEPAEAELSWLPSLRAEVLHPRHVRFLPPTCSGIATAWGVIVSGYTPLSRLKALAGPVRWDAYTPDMLKTMVDHRPQGASSLMATWASDDEDARRPLPDTDGMPPEDALVYYDCVYVTGKGNPEYPKGCYLWVAAEKHVITRGPWVESVAHDPNGPTVDDTSASPTSKQDRMVERPCDIPVVQVKQFIDPDRRDPYGRGLVAKLGNGDALTSTLFGLMIEALWRINNLKLLVPIGSGISDTQLALPAGTPIPYNPVNGGRPVWETPPDVAALMSGAKAMIEQVQGRQDSNSGLEQGAQGVNVPSVTSGVQAQTIVEQALKALSKPKQHLDDAFVRLQRIYLQLVRQTFTMPQKLKITGADGAYKAKEWTAADLGSTADVKILSGTSTMLTPSAKQAMLSQELQTGAISLEDYQRAKAGSLRAATGMQDSPHKMRVAGQIDEFEDGPPEGWVPVPPPVDAMGMPLIDPMTGQPAPAPQDPADPFPVGVNEDDPAVAPIRYQELVRALSGTKYRSKPPEWRALMDAAYLRARQAAGVLTIAEQQAQAAQAAAMGAEPGGPPGQEAA